MSVANDPLFIDLTTHQHGRVVLWDRVGADLVAQWFATGSTSSPVTTFTWFGAIVSYYYDGERYDALDDDLSRPRIGPWKQIGPMTWERPNGSHVWGKGDLTPVRNASDAFLIAHGDALAMWYPTPIPPAVPATDDPTEEIPPPPAPPRVAPGSYPIVEDGLYVGTLVVKECGPLLRDAGVYQGRWAGSTTWLPYTIGGLVAMGVPLAAAP